MAELKYEVGDTVQYNYGEDGHYDEKLGHHERGVVIQIFPGAWHGQDHIRWRKRDGLENGCGAGNRCLSLIQKGKRGRDGE